MKRILYLLLAPCLLPSCNLLWEFRELHEFKQFVWKQEEVVEMEGAVKSSGRYDVFVLFRHVHGFPFQNVAIEVGVVSRTMQKTERIIIPVIADSKEYLGDGSGDIWDIEHLWLKDIPLDSGNYHFSIRHDMPRGDLQLVMEVGIKVAKSKG